MEAENTDDIALRERVTSLETDLSQSEARVKSLEAQVKDSKDELEKSRNELKRFERKYDKVTAYNDDLRSQVESLSQELHNYKTRRKTTENESQTDEWTEYGANYTDYYSAYTHNTINEVITADGSAADKDAVKSVSAMSVADMVKEAATDAMHQSGYVYDEATGLYYDHKTGYYYDSENSLYYEPNSGCYYYYNEDSQEYVFHSQVDPSLLQTTTTTDRKDRRKKRSKKEVSEETIAKKKKLYKTSAKDEENAEKTLRTRKTRKTKRDKSENEQKDEGYSKHSSESEDEIRIVSIIKKPESDVTVVDSDRKVIADSSVDGDQPEQKTLNPEAIGVESPSSGQSSEIESGEISQSSSDEVESSEDDETVSSDEHVDECSALYYPPCIRVIVQESDCLEEGSLHVITYPGGTIGSESAMGHVLCIPDANISQMHADVRYNEEWRKYSLVDRGSVCGTFINDVRMSESERMSEALPISHRDVIKTAETSLLFHIHPGTETCNDCEPGIVQAHLRTRQQNEIVMFNTSEKADKEKQRRRELKQIRKKFGLEGEPYINKASTHNPNYEDKADERRRTKGSDNPYQRDECPASVHVAISRDNKGHKLMEKMGWKSGDTLGKMQTGIDEPIMVNIRSNQKAGLGSGFQRSMDEGHVVANDQRWLKAQERYRKASERPSGKTPKSMQWVKGETAGQNEDHPT